MQGTGAVRSDLLPDLEARGVYVRSLDWETVYRNLYDDLLDAGEGSGLGDAGVAAAFVAGRAGTPLPGDLAPWSEALKSLAWILEQRVPVRPAGTRVVAEVALGVVAGGGGDWSDLLDLLLAAEGDAEATANQLVE